MPTIKTVEQKIYAIEGFEIHFMRDGNNVRSDLADIPQYDYQRKANDDMTVTEWKTVRFKQSYPGFDAKVCDKSGQAVHGATKLETIR